MTTLLLGFVGLVIIPALVLSAVFNRLIREPVENTTRDDHAVFNFSPEHMRPETSDRILNKNL
jgi:hypothetical protein